MHSLPPREQFLWVQQYFGVSGFDDHPRPHTAPLLAPRPRPRPRPKLFP